MLMVRRIYLYLVSAISLIAVTWSIIGLARLILSEGIGQGQIIGLASLLATIIVGLPIFLFHWVMAQRLAAESEEERQTPVRQIYFYGIMAAGAAPIFSNVYRLVDNAFLALLGGTRPNYYPYDLTTAEHLAAIIVWLVVWIYIWRHVRPQLNRGRVNVLDINLSIRRLYLLAFSLGGLVMLTWGAVGLLQTLMQLSATVAAWRTPIANYSAQLLIGAGVWVGHWLLLQRDFSSGHPAEERSVLRKIYLYLAVFVFAVMSLSFGTLLLKRFIELALGAPPSGEPLLSRLSLPLPMTVVGGLFWGYHRYVLGQDAGQAPEVPRQAGVRRIYAYLVAALGLAALLGGVVGLLIQIVDLLTTPATIGFSYYREQVALFISMTVVGTPVWWLPWRAMQTMAVAPAQAGRADTTVTGADERKSTVRKIYLYFYVFVAALAVFGSIGWFVFRILTWLLGANLPDDFITLVLNALVVGLVAAGVWLYHWWAIRKDGELEQLDQARQLAGTTVVVIDGNEGKLGQRVIQHLQQELPGLNIRPIGVTPQAAQTMAGQPFSAAELGEANFIIGSWQTLTTAEVAPSIAAASATKFVVPLAEQNWLWAGVIPRSADEYARRAVTGVKQAIEGEEITFGRDLDFSTIAAIAGGALLFLCIAGSLLMVGINVFS